MPVRSVVMGMSANIRIREVKIGIRKVKVLQGRAKVEAEKQGLKPDDLVIVTNNHIEKIDGDPVSYLLKRSRSNT